MSSGNREELVDIISKWSIDDILNEDLFKDQLKEIPRTFESLIHYFESFRSPFLEETRAELASGLNRIADAPHVDASVEEFDDLSIRLKLSSASVVDERVYAPNLGDVVRLSTLVPGNVMELRNVETFSCLGFVTDVGRSDKKCCMIKLAENCSSGIKSRDLSVVVFFLVNSVTKSRIWNSLNVDVDDPNSNLNLIKQTLHVDGSAQKSCPCLLQNEFSLNENLLQSLKPKLLNDSQIKAICQILSTMSCSHAFSVGRISGFPGTGKTEIIAIASWIALKMQCKVVVCAPTLFSVLEVVSRVLKFVEQNSCNASDGRFAGSPLSDIIILGEYKNKRLNTFHGSSVVPLEDLLFHVEPCFSVSDGWKQCMILLADILDNICSKPDVFSECEQDDFQTGNLEELKKKFSSAAFSLKDCIQLLLRYIPRSLFSDVAVQNLSTLLSLIDSIWKFLCGDYVQFDRNEFCTLTNACLDVMRLLMNTLRIPVVADKQSIEELCLQHARLVFCPVSDLIKLQTTLRPLDGSCTPGLLIVDKACEVKECESLPLLQLDGLRHAILLGGNGYKPDVIIRKNLQQIGYGRSLFGRLSLLCHTKCNLDIQYRMHPSISHFPNKKFFKQKLLDSPITVDKGKTIPVLPECLSGAYRFMDVSDGIEMIDEQNKGPKNLLEAAVVCKIVLKLLKASSSFQNRLTIGVISPSAAQVHTIQTMLKDKDDVTCGFLFWVKSVNELESSEEDVIIISTVSSYDASSLGLLMDYRIANFCLTRARKFLWIVGNGEMLKRSPSVWEEVVRDAEERGCLYAANGDKLLANTIFNVKNEMKQLDELLNQKGTHFIGTKWKVFFSHDFSKSFVKIKSSQLKKGVINLLLKLASGWRPKRSNMYSVSGSSSQLIMQFKVDRFFIICTIDIMKYSSYIQVLKIWDILPLSETPKLIKRLESIFLTYSDDYVSRCRAKSVDRNNLEVPTMWGAHEGFLKYKNLLTEVQAVEVPDGGAFDGRNYVENSKVSESLLLMKFYSLTCGTVKHLLSNTNGEEIGVPFEVTDQERDIILYPQTSFILGRSGTGKTTVLTMKLIQKEQEWYLSSERHNDSLVENSGSPCKPDEGLVPSENFLRQLFVTVSPKLCSAVRNHIDHLKSFTCGGEFSGKACFDMYDIGDSLSAFSDIPDSFRNIPTKHYPLVITFEKFLIMLDGSWENSFFEKFYDVSELSLKKTGISRSVALQTLMRQKEVNYPRFSSLYWPRFNTHLTKKLDSSIVFTEIISHIKGSCTANEVFDAKLSREAYVSLSESRVSSLNIAVREVIYDIFLDYEKMKLMKGEFDISDLVSDLHQRATVCGRNVGAQMDFVYIDEVQDLTMRQISLFKYVCKNFAEGFVFAGDTAQTIARGIDFRFEEIRSLFYTEFLPDQNYEPMKKTKGRYKSISDMFHLSQNFRTHAGVLKLAQSVIDILCFYFPYSVDRLRPETSMIFGEPPILLESGNDENALMTLFGKSANNSHNSHINGFGADQVILVRDELSKQKIPQDVGKNSLVLTILECKGLEFQDVLLYNFFGDSPLKDHWRVIYDYMNSHNLLDSKMISSRSFEMARHNVLCSELKQLYVAITRTRQRLWICDNVEDYSEPMFHYWKNLCLVQVRCLDNSIAQAMFVASSSEEWRDRGIKLFNEGNYEMATMCFERAGDIFREKWSRASGLRTSAERILQSNNEMSRRLLIEAAEIYEDIGKVELVADCYILLKDFEKAGTIYLEKCGESRLHDAGDFLSKARRWSLAAKAYDKGNYYSECLSACSSGNLFDMGLQFIEYWRGDRTSKIFEVDVVDWEEIEFPFLDTCARHYHELKDSKQVMKFVKAFNSIDKARNFLKSRGYLDELLSMEEKLGNFVEAANIAKMKGDHLLQANMLEKAGHFEASSRLILDYVVINSLWTAGNNGWPLKTFKQKDDLLMKAKLLAEKSSGLPFESISLEINIVEDKEKGLADLVKILSSATRLKIVKAELFSARKILDIHMKSDPSKFHRESEVDDDPDKHVAKLLQNLFSSETLVFAWNIWKEKVFLVLDSLQKADDFPEVGSGRHLEFCMNYFGVQRNNDRTFVVYNPEAFWLRGSGVRSSKKDGKLALIGTNQFLSSVKSYWASELLSVGTEVLGCLDRFCIGHSLSSVSRGVALLRIFQVSKFLISYERGYRKSYSKSIHGILSETRRSFFNIVFPVDWRLELKESIIDLRKKELAKELLRDILVEIVSGKLTYEQIGRVAMIVMVCGKLEDELYESIINRLDKMQEWKIFMEYMRNTESGCRQIASSLRDALRSTFDIDWQNEVDYISPPTFLYLVEQLIFMLSACGSYFFTTKGSFVEALGCSDSYCCFNTDSHDQEFFTESVSCLAYMIGQILFDHPGTMQWIRTSKLTAHQYYPSLVLKLVIMIGVLHMNSGVPFKMLVDVLRQKAIVSVLSKAFHNHLCTLEEDNFHDIFATALMTIGDPLVMVCLTDDAPKFTFVNTLFIDMSSSRSREDMMDLLFPKNSCVFHQNEANICESGTSSDVGISSDCSVPDNKFASDLEFSKKGIAAIENDSTGYDFQDGFKHLCSTFDAIVLEHGKGSNDCKAKIVASNLKMEVQKFLSVVHTQVNILDKSSLHDDDKALLEEIQLLIDELTQLFNLLNGSEDGLLKCITVIEELINKLQKRRSRFQAYTHLMMKKGSSTSVENSALTAVSAKNNLGNKGASSKHQKKSKTKGKNRKK